jgi:hypothetical protein
MLGQVDQRRQHDDREQQHDGFQPARLDPRQEEGWDDQRERGVQRRHGRDSVAPVESILPTDGSGVQPHRREPSAGTPSERWGDVIVVRNHPRWGGGQDDEHHARHAQHRRKAFHEPGPLPVCGGPQRAHHDWNEDEVGEVGQRGNFVVPVHARFPEMLLQHDIRIVAEEQEPIDVAHRLHL